MLSNYLKIAWRNLNKNRFYSFLNILGLSISIAFVLLIGIYIWNEWSVNHDLKNASNQYIIQSIYKDPNQGNELTTLGPLARQLKEQYPSLVTNYCRWDGVTSTVTAGEKIFREGLQLCDSTMFTMYGFTLLYGNPLHVFDDPYSIVLTDEITKKYFSKEIYDHLENVIGKTLNIENFAGVNHDFKVTGILKKPRQNSVTLWNVNNDNQMYISVNDMKAYFGRDMESWQNQYIIGYIELKEGVKPKQLNEPMKHLIDANAPPTIALGMKPYLVPLKEYYLASNNSMVKKTLISLCLIAFFILLMAIVNFINLSIARSTSRMKEIGIRKTLGGLRLHLTFQFLSETVLLAGLSTILALFIIKLGQPGFESIIGKKLPSLFKLPLELYFTPLVLILCIGVIAGLYPAFILSNIKSVDCLKGKLSSINEKIYLRRILVGIQFTTAIIVFLGSIFISKQLNYSLTKDLGFDKDYVIYSQVPRNWSKTGVDNLEAKRKQFLQNNFIKQASVAFEIPDGNASGMASVYNATQDSTQAKGADLLTTDQYFADTYNITLLAGNYFTSNSTLQDSSRLVINEKLSKALGYSSPELAIDQKIRIEGASQLFSICGVVKDFHFGTLKGDIKPMTMMHLSLNPIYRFMAFKIQPGNISKSIHLLQQEWNKILPGAPFEYKFLDQTIANMYSLESQLKKASLLATILALIIVLLGVIGLVAQSIRIRTKEIGIRKILGSSILGLVNLFIKEFLVIIFISGLVACPVAYILVYKWLHSYSYRIDLSFQPFIIVIVMIGIITSSIIGILSIKAAFDNPVKSLRAE